MTTAYQDFLSDPLRRDVWLFEVTGYKLADGTTRTFRFSSDTFATEPDETPANTPYSARLLGAYSAKSGNVPTGSLGLLPTAEGGTVTVAQRFGDLDDVALSDYSFDGRDYVIRHGGTSRLGRLPFSDFGVVSVGEIEAADVGLDEVQFRLRSKASRFDHPLEDRTYRGTGFALDLAAGAYVDWSSPSKAAITGDVTVEGWFYLDATGTTMNLFGWEGTGRPFQFRKSSTERLRLIDSGSVDILTAGAVIPGASRWLHLSVSVTSTSATFLVYDATTGVETEHVVTGSGFSSRAAQSASTLRIGASTNGLDGTADEVRLWSYARTPDEIRDARHRELTDSEALDSRLKFYSKLNDGTGTACADSSASPATGTITGTYNWYHSLTGDASLRGQVLPNCFGKAQYLEPVLVEPRTRVYQVHSRSCNAILGVFEGGGSLTLNTAFTDQKLFLAATTPASKYDTMIDDHGTFVRLGSSPTLPLTVLAEGDAVGGYVETAAEIVARIASDFGPLATRLSYPGDFDTASFSDLAAANGATVGFFSKQEFTRGDAINFLLGTVGAVAYFDRLEGKLTVKRIETTAGATPVLALTEGDITRIAPFPVEMPAWDVRMSFAHCYKVHEEADLAPAVVTDDLRQFLTREWRLVDRKKESVLERFPFARTILVDTAFTEEADAEDETVRRLNLWSTRGQALKLTCRARAFQLDQLDLVSVHYQDMDSMGNLQSRLGTADDAIFYVLTFDENAENGEVVLVVWRDTYQ